MHADGNASTVVDDGDRAFGVNDDLNGVAVTCEMLVYCVVDRFPNQVMKAGPVVRIPDVHAGSLPHRLEPFEHLNGALIVAWLQPGSVPRSGGQPWVSF